MAKLRRFQEGGRFGSSTSRHGHGRHQITILFAIAILAILFLPTSGSAQTMRSIQQVVYGDRLIMDNGESVQLLGVWSPKPDPGKKDFKPDSAMGGGERRSREFTQGLVQGRQVWLTYGEPAKDSLGNSLAYVYFKIGSGQNLGGGGQQVSLGAGTYMLNRLLLTYGFAEVDNKANTSYKVEFQQLQSEAVMGRRGNWQMMTP